MAISKFCTQAMLFSSTPTNSEMQLASTSAVSLFFDEIDLDNAINYSILQNPWVVRFRMTKLE